MMILQHLALDRLNEMIKEMQNLKTKNLLLISFLLISLLPIFFMSMFHSVYIPLGIFWTAILLTGMVAIILAIFINSILLNKTNELEEQIKNLHEQIISQNKLASIGQLSAGIVHEIKNPLNFISNFAELCQDQLAKLHNCMDSINDKLNEIDKEKFNKILTHLNGNLEKINIHGRKANSIITRMLGQAKSGVPSDFVPTDINALLEEHFKLAYHAKRSENPSFNIQMQMDFDKSLGEVPILPLEIGRVILNMLNNAFYAVLEKKKNSGKDYTPIVAITTKKEGEDKLSISFYDNGIGMTKEVCEKIYDSFYSTKPAGEGTGLGLALSREIIMNAHHGEIHVDSKVGEYTVFTIILPLKQLE